MLRELFYIFTSFIGAIAALVLAGVVTLLLVRPLIKLVFGRITKRILTDHYGENLWEMVTAMMRTSPRKIVENSLRAQGSGVIERPFGTPRKFLDFDGLIFSPAQLVTLPAPETAEVNMSITIGPRAAKPLTLDIPLLPGGMAYGIGVSDRVKVAIAKGTAAVGTCTNSGEGPFLPEERAAAKFYILQYSAGHWAKEPEILKQADAIEIRLGQGAIAGAGSFLPGENIKGRVAELLNVPEGKQVIIPSRHAELARPKDLKRLVERLRDITGGVPIGVKMIPSARLEADLEIAIKGTVDFISIDGGQAGTKGGAPILEDDFGLPTIFALCRAVKYLKQRGVKDRITLLSGGGYTTPGECLKALALGADGIYMGTSLLWAMTHDQVIKSMPWEPPTQLTWYEGKMKDKFDEQASATYLSNFLTAYVEEMKLAIRALGKTDLGAVNRDDLVAIDEWTSKVTGIGLAHEAYEGPMVRRPLL